MQLHPDCQPLAFLLGTWKGAGEGHYPTIDPFRYNEEVIFGHVGKPFLSYTQKTRDAESGAPLHAEAGYLRAVDAERVEFVLVQPSGIVELHQGLVEGTSISFTLDAVRTTPSAKEVTNVSRDLSVTANDGSFALSYDISMEAVGQPMTHHLHAVLVRQPSE